jgi:hypothetical protein
LRNPICVLFLFFQNEPVKQRPTFSESTLYV